MPAPLNPIVRYACRQATQCMRVLARRAAGGRAIVGRAIVASAMLLIVPMALAQTLTTDEAVARAKQQVPGKLVAVSKERQGEQEVYRVRILGSDGVVRTVLVNANP